MKKHIQSHEQNNYNFKILSILKAIEVVEEKANPKIVNSIVSTFPNFWKVNQNPANTPPVEGSITYCPKELEYLKKASFYNIKLNTDQWCELTDLHMFDAVDSWEKKLKEALYLGVNWRMSDYDPNGLEQAIDEQELACDIDAQEERKCANAYYYSTRGC